MSKAVPCMCFDAGAPPTAPAHDEADHALGLDGIEAEMPGQRGNRCAGAFQRPDHIALDRTPEAGNVDECLVEARSQAQVAHEGRQRHRSQPSGQPVTQPPVWAIGPDAGQFGKERIGPCVPGPGGAFRNMHHPAAVDGRRRVVRALAPAEIAGFEIGTLDRVIAPAAGEIRGEALG